MGNQTIRTTCSYCSVGCNFNAVIGDDGVLKSFLPNKTYPVNLGKSCPKGFNLLKAFASADRATSPLLRNESGALEPVGWERALAEFTTRFKKIKKEHGPESVAYLSTGQIPFEEMALLGAVFKFGMGFVHADGNTRQCMATAAVAYKQAFGFDAPPFSYKDFEISDLMIFVGANPVIAHPVIWNRVKMNANDPTIVAIDPRKTRTADQSTIHFGITPKSDLTLLYAIARELIHRQWIDRPFIEAHTEGFEEFAAHVEAFTLERAAAESGIEAARIADLAKRIRASKAMSIYWTMGVNQSHQAVRTAQAIINLCLMTGNIGRPGTGPNSITGQANAMGSRLYSNTTSMFAGYDFTKKDDRNAVAGILGIEPSRIPDRNSFPYHKILEAVDSGTIKGLWIIATNPAHSWIDKNELFRRLEKLDFLVVQDLYTTTETAQRADLILPAAGSGEKTGTLINSERRLGVVQKIMDPPGDALPDFEIFRRIAEAWGCADVVKGWTDPEAAFGILQQVSRGRPCDITGIDGYQMLRDRQGIQWPYPKGGSDESPDRRLFADGKFFTDSGRAKFLFDEVAQVPEPTDTDYPFVLLTGRGSVAQWHTQTRTGKVEMLRKLYPAEAYAEVNPSDAERLGLSDGDRVRVSSRRDSIVVNVQVNEGIQSGHVFLPMHYEETNLLTFPSFDPYSAEPSYKHSAVKLEPQS